ncbi:MAG: pectinesterase family protein [Reichenbachiella sp.]
MSMPEYDFIVTKDGSGDFTSIQDAFDNVPDVRKATTTIFIKSGVYKEKLVLADSKTNVHLIGESNISTIVTYDDYSSKLNRFGEPKGTSGSSSFYVFGDGFTASNITFENSAGRVGQAVAVRVSADKVVFDNCRFLGNQDTLYPYGKGSRQYYKNCYIEGTVDFIFGWSTVVFDSCEIFSKKGGSYITAASTEEDSAYGFVFMNCKLTSDADQENAYLGRPWRDYAKTVFINCEMGSHIKPEGWHNWNKPEAESTTFYAEFNSSGKGGNNENRVEWSHLLSEDEASEYTIDKILNGWNPRLGQLVKP